MKLYLIVLATTLALTACDASTTAPANSTATITTHPNTVTTPPPACTVPSLLNTTWQCESDCNVLPFNYLTLYASGGNKRADIFDFNGTTLQPLGCYNLGGGDFLAGGDLDLNATAYGCPQGIPINEIYPSSQDCDKLVINGITFDKR